MNGLWLVLLILAIKIISLVMQHRKKEQERKEREEALRQRAAQSGGAASAPPTIGVPAPAPAGVTAGSDIEARRQAQLEQLRQRREGRRGNVTDVQARLPTAPARRGVPIATQPASRGPSTVLPTIISSEKSRIRAQEQERRAREAERQRRDQQGRIAAARQEAEDAAAHREYEKGFHSVAGEADAKAHGVTATKSAVGAALSRPEDSDRAGVAAAVLLARMREPAALREAILLREIIDRPLALRDPAA